MVEPSPCRPKDSNACCALLARPAQSLIQIRVALIGGGDEHCSRCDQRLSLNVREGVTITGDDLRG